MLYPALHRRCEGVLRPRDGAAELRVQFSRLFRYQGRAPLFSSRCCSTEPSFFSMGIAKQKPRRKTILHRQTGRAACLRIAAPFWLRLAGGKSGPTPCPAGGSSLADQGGENVA